MFNTITNQRLKRRYNSSEEPEENGIRENTKLSWLLVSDNGEWNKQRDARNQFKPRAKRRRRVRKINVFVLRLLLLRNRAFELNSR